MFAKNIRQRPLPTPELVVPRGKDRKTGSTNESSLVAKVGVVVLLILFGALHFIGAAIIYRSDTGPAGQTHTLASD
jgi:hypothetical protein